MRRLILFTTLLVLACSQTTNPSDGGWKSTELVGVTTDKTFTISELERPVLVESFAVWCPACTKQQRQMSKLDVGTHVSLNTDPNANRKTVREHVQKNGFVHRFALAPKNMTRALIDEFGTGVVHAPSSPVILICDGNATLLPSGLKTTDELREQIDTRCA